MEEVGEVPGETSLLLLRRVYIWLLQEEKASQESESSVEWDHKPEDWERKVFQNHLHVPEAGGQILIFICCCAKQTIRHRHIQLDRSATTQVILSRCAGFGWDRVHFLHSS